MKSRVRYFACSLLLAAGLAGATVVWAQDADRLQQEGIEARRAGRFNDAIDRLEAAAKLRPDNTDIQLELGLALTAVGRFDDAEKALRRVLEISPDYHDARLGLARIAFLRKNYDGALALAREFLTRRPDDTDGQRLLDQIERARRLASSKLEDLETEAKKSPNDADIQFRLGYGLLRVGRVPEAEKAFRRVLEISADYLDAHTGLARVEYARKNYTKARQELQAVLSKRPNDSDARELSRLIDRATRLTSASLPDLIKEAKATPDDADVQLQLGLALSKAKRYDEAEKAFRRVLEIAPDYLDANVGLARLSYYRKQYEKARREIRTVLAKRPNDADAKELLRLVERAMRAPKEAEKGKAEGAKPYPTPYWRIDINAERSWLTGSRPPWNQGDARINYVFKPGTAIGVGADVARHFDTTDTYLDMRIDHKPLEWLSGYVYGGATPNPHFRPRWAVGGGLAAVVNKQSGPISTTVLTVDARWGQYVSGPTRLATPGVEQYFLDGKLWVTAQWINMVDETNSQRQGYLLRGDVLLRDDLRFFAAYADAPETSDGFTVITRSLFGGLVYDLTNRITLRGSLGYERRPGLYDRTLVGLGASVKF